MKRALPWGEQVDVLSSDESSAGDADIGNGGYDCHDDAIDQPDLEVSPEVLLWKRAEMYQEYMKNIPIPAFRGSIIPFTSWVALGNSIKQLYEQPLHYLTNILLKQWDRQRLDSEDEHTPLDTKIHPRKAEATIWLVEEVHRGTTSHHQLAEIWLSVPMYHALIDSGLQASDKMSRKRPAPSDVSSKMKKRRLAKRQKGGNPPQEKLLGSAIAVGSRSQLPKLTKEKTLLVIPALPPICAPIIEGASSSRAHENQTWPPPQEPGRPDDQGGRSSSGVLKQMGKKAEDHPYFKRHVALMKKYYEFEKTKSVLVLKKRSQTNWANFAKEMMIQVRLFLTLL